MSKKTNKLNSIISSDYDFKKLKIKAIDLDDLTILSSLCQDGIFSVDEIAYLKEEKKLVATFSRFCWELKNIPDYDKKVHFRVVSGLQIHNVLKINYNNFENINDNNFLNLLSIRYNNNYISFNFSLNSSIDIKVKKINILLDDFDIPWPTVKKPMHK